MRTLKRRTRYLRPQRPDISIVVERIHIESPTFPSSHKINTLPTPPIPTMTSQTILRRPWPLMFTTLSLPIPLPVLRVQYSHGICSLVAACVQLLGEPFLSLNGLLGDFLSWYSGFDLPIEEEYTYFSVIFKDLVDQMRLSHVSHDCHLTLCRTFECRHMFLVVLFDTRFLLGEHSEGGLVLMTKVGS